MPKRLVNANEIGDSMFINEYGDKNNPLFLLLASKEIETFIGGQ